MPLLCGVVMMSSCKEETIDLRFVPEKNQPYELAYQEDLTADYKGAKQTHSLGSSLILKPVQDTGLNINATYKRFWVKVINATDSLNVDTDHPVPYRSDDPRTLVPAVWQGVQGQSFSYGMNNLGKLENIGSFTPLLHAITKKVLPDSTAANSAEFSKVWDIAAGQFSPAAASAMLSSIFPEFPGYMIKKGDTLNRVYQVPGAIPLTVLQVYKVSEIKGDQVTLILGGSGFTDNTTSTSLKVGQEGSFKINRHTGMIESVYIEAVMEGKVENEPYKQSSVIRASCKKL
ncbi:MAG: DUF6263 family protein [Pseudobacter sp.]|uniref:DUF6263 family protein n=1 Tax=Pseudobacter sp. TaxID=2045420 RepID=UPI003F7ED393